MASVRALAVFLLGLTVVAPAASAADLEVSTSGAESVDGDSFREYLRVELFGRDVESVSLESVNRTSVRIKMIRNGKMFSRDVETDDIGNQKKERVLALAAAELARESEDPPIAPAPPIVGSVTAPKTESADRSPATPRTTSRKWFATLLIGAEAGISTPWIAPSLRLGGGAHLDAWSLEATVTALTTRNTDALGSIGVFGIGADLYPSFNTRVSRTVALGVGPRLGWRLIHASASANQNATERDAFGSRISAGAETRFIASVSNSLNVVVGAGASYVLTPLVFRAGTRDVLATEGLLVDAMLGVQLQ